MVSSGKLRRIAASCISCMDNSRKKCRECGCKVCAGKEEEHNQLFYDECDSCYHLGCLNPLLTPKSQRRTIGTVQNVKLMRTKLRRWETS